jgi:hypothetical protein
MDGDTGGGRVVCSRLVHPSYRTIDLRPLLQDASQELPPPPFDVVHVVTAQDYVAVHLMIIEHSGAPPELSARTPALSGTVHLPTGWLLIDPPAAALDRYCGQERWTVHFWPTD